MQNRTRDLSREKKILERIQMKKILNFKWFPFQRVEKNTFFSFNKKSISTEKINFAELKSLFDFIPKY